MDLKITEEQIKEIYSQTKKHAEEVIDVARKLNLNSKDIREVYASLIAMGVRTRIYQHIIGEVKEGG